MQVSDPILLEQPQSNKAALEGGRVRSIRSSTDTGFDPLTISTTVPHLALRSHPHSLAIALSNVSPLQYFIAVDIVHRSALRFREPRKRSYGHLFVINKHFIMIIKYTCTIG